jgi:hypothetical protein
VAIIYSLQGKYDQALQIFKSILEIKTQMCGHTHTELPAFTRTLGIF